MIAFASYPLYLKLDTAMDRYAAGHAGHGEDGMVEHRRAGRDIARADLAEEGEGEIQKEMDVGEGRMKKLSTHGRAFYVPLTPSCASSA